MNASKFVPNKIIPPSLIFVNKAIAYWSGALYSVQLQE